MSWPVTQGQLGAILAIVVLIACVVLGILALVGTFSSIPLAILILIGLLALARLT